MASDITALGKLLTRVRDSAFTEPDASAEESVADLHPEGDDLIEFVLRFGALIMLSASIAAFGLLADSAAVVIGAMLVAPLMTPILATAAALVRAENGRLALSLLILAGGTVLAIVVGAAVSAIAGSVIDSSAELPREIEARTFPGLLDLGIAVTAGAAAGYVVPRRSATGALPGVGIAVALVPPLAVVGITLQSGHADESSNALLLYVTNLAAIIFSASFMLVLAGFRPRQAGSRRTLTTRLVITIGAVVAVALPLSLHTRSTLRDSRLRAAVLESVAEWDPSASVVRLDARVTDGRGDVTLLVAGANEPREAWQLAEGVGGRYGGPVDLDLSYTQDQRFQVSVR
jgi:uncharacterized hydrophobic protein (TIGR00271 family)